MPDTNMISGQGRRHDFESGGHGLFVFYFLLAAQVAYT